MKARKERIWSHKNNNVSVNQITNTASSSYNNANVINVDIFLLVIKINVTQLGHN